MDDGFEPVITRARRRWRDLDPLLGGTVPPGRPDLIVRDDRTVTAVAHTTRRRQDPAVLEAAFGPLDEARLTPFTPGPDVDGPLRVLLAAWERRLAGNRPAPGVDSGVLVHWPSRDIAGVRALLDHGLAPREILAARRTGAPAVPAPAAGALGVRIRPATPDDLDAITVRYREVVDLDTRVGALELRENTAALIRDSVAKHLARERAWIWLAEHDSHVVGVAMVDAPEHAGWASPLTSADPAEVAYLGIMHVDRAARGSGVGAVLATHAHREIDAAGVRVTLLHHAVANPHSGPFWARMGYRPLWTAWRASPIGGRR